MLAIDVRTNRVIRVVGPSKTVYKHVVIRNPDGDRETIPGVWIKFI